MKARTAVYSIISLFLIFFSPLSHFHGRDDANLNQTYAFSSGDSDDIGRALYDRALLVFNNATSTSYENSDKDAKDLVRITGSDLYEVKADCSGFISYLLYSVCPEQYEVIRKRESACRYPLSRTYQEFFSSLPSGTPSEGWLKIESLRALKRGDIIAWKKPGSNTHKGGTGHMMMVMEPPLDIVEEVVNKDTIRYVSIFVIDSSSVYHFKPEYFPPRAGQVHRNGLGKGFIRLILNKKDIPVGYWEGTYSGKNREDIKGPTYSDKIAFARVVPKKGPALTELLTSP